MAARHDAINEGYDIEDYQQDWLVDDVKLTFFVLEPENGRDKLAKDPGNPWLENIRLASLDTLFVTKSLVLSDRHAFRDNFDMKVLLELSEFSYEDLIDAYKVYRPETSLEIPKKRLLCTDYPLTDPGLLGLIEEEEKLTINRVHRYFDSLLNNID